MRNLIAAAMVAFSLAACAKKQPVGDLNLSPRVSITVQNNFTPVDQVQVFMTTQTGGQQVLGTVSPGRTVKFNYQPTNANDKFTLVAQMTNGRKLMSQVFSLVNAESVSWDLRSNTMQIYEP